MKNGKVVSVDLLRKLEAIDIRLCMLQPIGPLKGDRNLKGFVFVRLVLFAFLLGSEGELLLTEGLVRAFQDLDTVGFSRFFQKCPQEAGTP